MALRFFGDVERAAFPWLVVFLGVGCGPAEREDVYADNAASGGSEPTGTGDTDGTPSAGTTAGGNPSGDRDDELGAGCSLSPAIPLESDVGGITSKPVVVRGDDDQVVVVWLQEAGPNQEIRAVRFEPGDEPAAHLVVKPAGEGRSVSGRTVGVGSSSNGHVVVAWDESGQEFLEGRVVSVMNPESGAWNEIGAVEFPASLTRPWENLSLAVSNDGDVAMFWVSDAREDAAGIGIHTGGSWSTLVVEDAGGRPFVEFSPSGVVHLAYTRTGTGTLVTRTYEKDELSDIEVLAEEGTAPQLRFDAQGNGLFAWRQVDAGDYSLFARWNRGGEWSDPRVIEMETDPVDVFHLAVAPNGNAAIGWCTRAASYTGRPHAISYDQKADVWSPSGELASIGGCTEPVVGVNAMGRAAFTWNAQLHRLKTSYLTPDGWTEEYGFGGRGLWASMVLTESGDVVRVWSVGEDEGESDLMVDVCTPQ